MPCFLVTTLCGYALSYGVLLLGIVYLPTFMFSCHWNWSYKGALEIMLCFLGHSFVANTPLFIIFMVILLNRVSGNKRRK